MTEVDESMDKWSMGGWWVGGSVGWWPVILMKTKLISRKVPVWRFEYKFTYLKWFLYNFYTFCVELRSFKMQLLVGCYCCFFVVVVVFFLSRFSFTYTDDSLGTGQQGKGEEREDPLTNIKTFIGNFAC